VQRLAERLARQRLPRPRLTLIDTTRVDPPLLSSLYCLLPLDTILAALRDTDSASARIRRLPAHEVVWLVVAASLFRARSLPMVWRHLHPSCDRAAPVDSAFTAARQRLGARPLKLLFHRTCRPLALPAMAGVWHGPWLVVALDGSVFEAPDTPANRRALGSASNQHGSQGAFPQLRLVAICEVGTHAITDVEMGPYACSEQGLSLKMLGRLPKGRLVLMDRGLSYFELVAAVRRRHSHVLARVKVSRALPVEKALPDGSYFSTIYPGYNQRRARRGGIRVRVIRYTHDDPCRDGRGEETVLITTLLSVEALSARQAVSLYPWRWEEESVFAEIKETLLLNKQPLLRSKQPALVVQEVYGLLIGHYLMRREMAQAAERAGAEAVRLSFKRSLEVLEDRMREEARPGWLAGLRAEMSRQKLRPKRVRRYPRVKKATRSRWPNKKPGSKPPPQPTKPFAKVMRILLTDGH
jgi:Insertion element 4 transposase N-terminal/Transposase DDE domain